MADLKYIEYCASLCTSILEVRQEEEYREKIKLVNQLMVLIYGERCIANLHSLAI